MDYKEVSKRLSKGEVEKYSLGIALVGNLVDTLRKQGLLPKRFARVEFIGEAITFTEEERKALVDDGAVPYLLTGETIKSQKSAKRRPFVEVADGYEVDGKNRLTEFPSRIMEVAIYPDPERFFVPNSFNKTTDQQIALVEQDAQFLRERLRQPKIGQILPEVSEVTEVLFKHVNATKVRILGKGYGKWSYIRTGTPTNKEGSYVASVGRWDRGGLYVNEWNRSISSTLLGAARWVVPLSISHMTK